MNNINVAATKASITTKPHQSPSLLRSWWTNNNLRYDAAISSVLIILNVEAIMYMTTHEIPLPGNFLAYFELAFAEKSLHRVAEEESELCMLMESLQLELENVKKVHSQLNEKQNKHLIIAESKMCYVYQVFPLCEGSA
ncbi:unnamed protein product [Eruca vesicaria subsp. sativa]|uniref:Uncharacterized protein n=1 Tax=Eruca vesicaria subsp. sativa TaxID=29727 RepID=A0ABC8LMF6_ERUVS|nr:unnamed protein product [Eruca vesicaria subsp. sativa]